MAQTGYTPILIYSSTTAAQAPDAAKLTNSTLGSELAINITDGKLFYKDNSNAVQVIAWKVTPTTAGGTGLTSYTAGDMLYYASGTTLTKLAIGTANKFMTSSGTAPQWASNLTFDGTTMNFSSTGQSLTADFSSSPVTNRLAIKTNVTNGDTRLQITPNGTGTLSGVTFYTDSARAAGAFLTLEMRGTESRISATGFTSGDYYPLTMYVGGSNRFQIGTSGQWGIGGATYGTAGQAFLSGGASAAPTWGTLGVGGGGTGATTLTGVVYGNGTSAFTAATAAQIVSAISTTAVTNATNAANVTITNDDTTNSTFYPLFASTGTTAVKQSQSYLTWNPGAFQFWIGNPSGANATLAVGGTRNTGNAARLGLTSIGGSSGGGSYPFVGYNMAFTATTTINYNGTDTAAAIQFGASGGSIQTYTAASGSAGSAISFTAGPYVAQGGTSWTNSSDERLKNIEGEITGALDMVDQFRAVYHTWKSDATQKRRVSLIAQDLLPVLPEAVNVPTMEFDARSGDRLYMGIEYDYVIPVLVAAIKELRSEFNAYKAAHP